MQPTHNRILVRVNMAQKNEFRIGDVLVKAALEYESNFRERSPVIAQVVIGNDKVNAGDLICCHHNHFFPPSPYHLEDDLYSIPVNKTIFGVFKKDGYLSPLYTNIFGEKVIIPTPLPVPSEQQKKYTDRILVTDGRNTKYKKGEIILTRPSAPYDIVYYWDKVQYRITKVSSDMVVGRIV